jgi:hypothetical protein
VAPHRDALSGAGRDGVDDGGDVFELALDGIVRPVAAGAATAAVKRPASASLLLVGFMASSSAVRALMVMP